MKRYNFKFKDRFNRKCAHHQGSELGYDETRRYYGVLKRNDLPASLSINGNIFWQNTKFERHCSIGPSYSRITGVQDYYLNNKRVSRMEVMMS